MDSQILKEIKELRAVIALLIGSSDLPVKQQFSMDAIKKAAAEFQKLTIERGEWIAETDIHKIIRKAPWYCAAFIIEKFKFTNYFKRGKTYYFNKKTIIALNSELKRRNIDIGQYMELEHDKAKFREFLEKLKTTIGSKKKPQFVIPEELRNITTSPYNHPPKEIVEKHIESLMEEFKTFKMVQFVNIYYESHAMFKLIYHFDKYIDVDVRRRCTNWCRQFNYAQNALMETKNIKSETIYT